MIAYKGFKPGLVCLGYQFVMGKNVTDKANCRQNGFHCAENPLDCLVHYPDMDGSDYYVVNAGGDLDEDDIDSKISCTELTILKKLTREEFFLHCLAYMANRPERKWCSLVHKDQGEAWRGYAVVRGRDPVACGKLGDILAFAKEDTAGRRIEQIGLARVDGEKVLPGVWYGIDLTLKLTYQDGRLVQAATRGDGDEGEIVTHNTWGISGIPQTIPYKERLVVTGEAFIRPGDFELLCNTLTDSSGEPYRNGRNLAAGSVRLLNAADCAARRVTFMPFGVIEGFPDLTLKSKKLYRLAELGFSPCKFFVTTRSLNQQEAESGIARLRGYARENDIPIDGIVASYNDIAYSATCGRTGHHYKDGLAFKFEDETFETVLREIEWNPTRTGEIAPVAIFDTVQIDGCEVSRASLHNLNFINALQLKSGCRVLVSKRNQIIPHIEDNLDRGTDFSLAAVIPRTCPCCGQATRVYVHRGSKTGATMTLHCDNEQCGTRRLRKFVHFAGKKAMNIEGLSEGTLEKLIGRGWLQSYLDVYRLDEHAAEIIRMDGFGEKSWQKLWDAIQRSRNTTFERYVVAMDIPLVGRTASGVLAKQFDSDLAAFEEAALTGYDFTQLPDFGEALNESICKWFEDEENFCTWEELQTMVNIQKPQPASTAPAASNNPFVGKNIVVTGKVEPYTRSEMNALIESLGAHAQSAVSGKTDYLVCGESAGSKLAKARQLGVTVLTPDRFFSMAQGTKEAAA